MSSHDLPGVKQVPIDHLLEDKTYIFFSHTIKAQPENMPLLDAMLQKVRCLGGGAEETGERGAERRQEREGRERRRWRERKSEKKTGGGGRTKDRWTTGAKDLVMCYTCYVGCRISVL